MKKLRTNRDVASEYGVSQRTAETWAARSDWPGREPDGSFSRRKIKSFLRKNGLGPFNATRGEKAQTRRDSLHEANRQFAIEKTEHLKLINARLRRELREKINGLVLAEDFRKIASETRQAVLAVVEGLEGEMAILLDADLSEQKWPQYRQEILDLASSLPKRVAEEVQKLL